MAADPATTAADHADQRALKGAHDRGLGLGLGHALAHFTGVVGEGAKAGVVGVAVAVGAEGDGCGDRGGRA